MTSIDRLQVLVGLPAGLPLIVMTSVWQFKLRALAALPYEQRATEAARLEARYRRLLTVAAAFLLIVEFAILAPRGTELICVVPMLALLYVILATAIKRGLDWVTTRQLDLWYDESRGGPPES